MFYVHRAVALRCLKWLIDNPLLLLKVSHLAINCKSREQPAWKVKVKGRIFIMNHPWHLWPNDCGHKILFMINWPKK